MTGKVRHRKKGMEEKDLRVKMAKTKVLKCYKKCSESEESGKFPCGVCQKGVGRNSILCNTCRKWVHHKCSGIKGKLKNIAFKFTACVGRQDTKSVKKLLLGPDSSLEIVDRFCYLGDVIGEEGIMSKNYRVGIMSKNYVCMGKI